MWKNAVLKIIFRVVLFLAVFSGTALIVNAVSNRGSSEAGVELTGTTLPVAFTCVDGKLLSPLPAYLTEMDSSLIRDGVIPLIGEDRKVTFYVEERAYNIQNAGYELRDPVNGNLIEEGALTSTDRKDGRLCYTAELRMDMKMDREYTVVLLVETKEKGMLRYYARVIRLEKNRTDSFFAAADAFRALLSEERNETQKKTLEGYRPDSLPDDFVTDDQGFVSLGSDYETLTWGEMKPELSGEMWISLTSLTTESGELTYRYRICTADEELTKLTYYEVEENFSLEFVPEKDAAEVVGYFRRLKKVFQLADFDRDINGLWFGLSDRAPDHLVSDDLEHMLFARDGDVWYYDYAASTLTRIYGSEVREFLYTRQEGFKMLSIDSEDAYFAVYGRMDSGLHEGENGILVEHYRIKDRLIEEFAFIRTPLSFASLEADSSQLLYLDREEKKLYCFLAGTLRAFSADKDEILAEGLTGKDIQVSRDGAVIALPEGTAPGYDRIRLWDLAGGIQTTLEVPGMKVVPLSFVGTDLVYGVAAPERVGVAADGRTRCQYTRVVFVKRNGKQEKDYRKSGILVSEVTFLSNTIYLKRMQEQGEGMSAAVASPDYISYKTEDNRDKATLENIPELGYRLVFPSFIYLTSVPELLMARTDVKESREIVVEGMEDTSLAFLYRGGEMLERSDRIGALIRDAVKVGGNVICADGTVLYRKKRGVPYLTVAEKVEYIEAKSDEDGFAACLAMCIRTAGINVEPDKVRSVLEKESGTGRWEEVFRELSGGEARGLNLSGADLDTAILFLGDGVPFATRLEDRYVLVVSFNSDAIRYYDPIRKGEVRTDRNSFRRKVAASGDEFYLYLK